MTLREQNQAKLDGIADKCGLPRKALKLLGDEQVTMQPQPTADYKAVNCALGEILHGKAVLKLGFVGKEHFPGNEQ